MAGKKDTKKSEEKKVETAVIVAPVSAAIKLPKAFYIEKINGVWRFITADVDGDKLINKHVKDADNKALSLEYFKVTFAKFYYFGK